MKCGDFCDILRMEIPPSREIVQFLPAAIFILGLLGAIVGISTIPENLTLGVSETVIGLASIFGSFIAAGATFHQ